MGTNYYRIPKSKEVMERYQVLHDKVTRLDWFDTIQLHNDFRNIENPESEWEMFNPWDEFTYNMKIHLGKRSMGWKFIWNWNNGKFYKDKDELFKYIRKGRVIDEYGQLIDVEEFIQMALDWCKDDGWDTDSYYKENPSHRPTWFSGKHEEYIDGLRVSTSTDFS